MLTKPVFLASDNALKFILTMGLDETVVTDLAYITRIVITINGQDYDSDVLGSGVISWNETTTYEGQLTGYVKLVLGGQAITAGYYTGCVMRIFDAANTQGVVWSDDLIIPVL